MYVIVMTTKNANLLFLSYRGEFLPAEEFMGKANNLYKTIDLEQAKEELDMTGNAQAVVEDYKFFQDELSR